jgi:hypothetical protein
MKSKFLNSGRYVIAKNLVGSDMPLNCMYVTYGPQEMAEAPESSGRFFDQLADQPGCGYARVAISSHFVKPNGEIEFHAIVTEDDLVGDMPSTDTKLTSATLAHMKGVHAADDVFVYSSVLKNTIPVKTGSIMVISMKLGLGA